MRLYLPIATLLGLLWIMPSAAFAAAPIHTFAEPERPADSFLDTSWYASIDDFTNIYSQSPPSTIVRNVGSGFLYSTLHGRVTADDGSEWYMINENEYVQATRVQESKASIFQGTVVQKQPVRHFGWIVAPVRPSNHVGGKPDKSFLTLQRYDFIQVYEVDSDSNGQIWYNIGGGRWITQHNTRVVDRDERPSSVGQDEFWVEIDLSEQTIAAYEGDRMVYATIISTGLAQWPTREGLFQVGERWERTKMLGAENQEDYYSVEDVPYTLYFDNAIALHGAYWHNNFGYQHSHGCVNMPPRDSEWVFNWSLDAPSALWVWVHSSDRADHATTIAKSTPSVIPIVDALSQSPRMSLHLLR